MKKIALLGSTGSIGTQTLQVVDDKSEDFVITSLACGHNVDLLEKQIRKYKPHLAAIWEEKDAAELRVRLADLDPAVEIVSGMDGLIAVAEDPESDILLTAIVGMLGIRPTIAGIKAGKDIALANKETLVCAGHIIMPLAEEYGVDILPVDSEHSAIYQSLQGNQFNKIHRILLTASGGPFRGKTREELEHVTLEQALNHPNWSMGKKITVDSASLVNKGLEVIEAKWLFGVEPSQIQVLVHPQSILHSAVEYEDGAVIGQMGTPDMKLPIQYALYYPRRFSMPEKKLNLFEVGTLTFEEPNTEVFKGLPLAYEAIRRGGNVPTVLNAANEKAVALFLDHKISFLTIYDIIEECMNEIPQIHEPTLEQILETEAAVYEFIGKKFGV